MLKDPGTCKPHSGGASEAPVGLRGQQLGLKPGLGRPLGHPRWAQMQMTEKSEHEVKVRKFKHLKIGNRGMKWVKRNLWGTSFQVSLGTLNPHYLKPHTQKKIECRYLGANDMTKQLTFL